MEKLGALNCYPSLHDAVTGSIFFRRRVIDLPPADYRGRPSRIDAVVIFDEGVVDSCNKITLSIRWGDGKIQKFSRKTGLKLGASFSREEILSHSAVMRIIGNMYEESPPASVEAHNARQWVRYNDRKAQYEASKARYEAETGIAGWREVFPDGSKMLKLAVKLSGDFEQLSTELEKAENRMRRDLESGSMIGRDELTERNYLLVAKSHAENYLAWLKRIHAGEEGWDEERLCSAILRHFLNTVNAAATTNESSSRGEFPRDRDAAGKLAKKLWSWARITDEWVEQNGERLLSGI